LISRTSNSLVIIDGNNSGENRTSDENNNENIFKSKRLKRFKLKSRNNNLNIIILIINKINIYINSFIYYSNIN